ncbi:hypothetical protein BDR22DRAFT_893540 [Usnea florida]
MAVNEEDKRVENDADFFYTSKESGPVSLGPVVSFKNYQPQLDNAVLPDMKHLEPPGSMAQRLVLGHREEKHRVILWSKYQWAEKIRLNFDVQAQATTLTKNIQEFNREASKSQKDLLKAAENDFQAVLEEAQKKQNAKNLKSASRPAWAAKLQSGLSTFCETAHHYQAVLDVLNEQAPEYTSAIWGAIKILLMASVNSEKLKQGIHANLQELGRQFGIMRVFVDLQPSETLVQTVIAAYRDFIKFLKKAVKFYTQCLPMRLINSVARPWETRFEPIVTQIREHVRNIEKTAEVGHMITSAKTLEATHRLENGQTKISHGLQILGQGDREILQEQQKLGQGQHKQDKILADLKAMMEKSLQPSHSIDNRALFVQSNGQRPITEVQGKAIEYMESIETTTRADEVEQREEDWLAYYAKPEDKIEIFRDEVFPMLYKLDSCIERDIHRVLKHGRLETIGATNLHQREEVRAWIESIQSELLWIDGFAKVGSLDWTTNFCLEVEDAAKPIKTITVLSYYCSGQANTTLSSRPETILQSFIFQLISRHRQMFTWIACREFCLTRFRFQEARESSTKLWALFYDCLRIAGPECLYVTLDNIDVLWSNCKGSEGVERFENILQGMNRLAREEKRLDKILITSRLPDALECFSAMGTTHSPKMTIVKIPQRAQIGVTVFGPPRKINRLPIRRSTAPQDPPDLETLLANIDKSDEEDALDSESEDVPAESPQYRDSDDDDEYGRELLHSSKDYARYLDTPEDSDSDVEESSHTLHVGKSNILLRKLTAIEGTQTVNKADGRYSSPGGHSQGAESVLTSYKTDEDSDADPDLDVKLLRQLATGRKAETAIPKGHEHEDSDADDDFDDLLHEPFRKAKNSKDDTNEPPLGPKDLAVKVRKDGGDSEVDDVDSDACASDLATW